ncbi:UPF0598 protein CG30010 [Condylostylus longicornis]|uniref:UPF0598 protein CG30010 n=1 Tax=Condylostylus longicornis TaxID=2530218 RepID=UPI00244E3E08|nr:UPF0598 protein CG30010 [Condylostylus longicornis]
MTLIRNITKEFIKNIRSVHYIQGQEPQPKIREYFYYIDHEGMLFLDDSKMKNFTSCFKDKKFLKFFFDRIRLNETGRYNDFPFLSLCGRERNFIRCDDLPIVYTHLIKSKEEKYKLSYAHAGELLTTNFQPEKIYMNPVSGRVYHPAWEKVGNIGLIRSKLAIELSKNFEFKNGEASPPTHFQWEGNIITLNTKWVENSILSKTYIKK